MATYTKEEAARELERYRQMQQEIADATNAAAKEQYLRAVASAEQTAAEKTAAAMETARNRYDAVRIQQLADTYRLAEQIAKFFLQVFHACVKIDRFIPVYKFYVAAWNKIVAFFYDFFFGCTVAEFWNVFVSFVFTCLLPCVES